MDLPDRPAGHPPQQRPSMRRSASMHLPGKLFEQDPEPVRCRSLHGPLSRTECVYVGRCVAPRTLASAPLIPDVYGLMLTVKRKGAGGRRAHGATPTHTRHRSRHEHAEGRSCTRSGDFPPPRNQEHRPVGQDRTVGSLSKRRVPCRRTEQRTCTIRSQSGEA